MGAFSPIPQPPDQGPPGGGGFQSPAALAENGPGALGGQVQEEGLSRDIAALTQAEELILAVGAQPQHLQYPLVAEKIRAALEAIREVAAATQASMQVGMRDETSPVP